MRRDSKPAPGWQEPAKREAIEVQLQLITPMFGGGYKTREVDPLMPIRPAAIRGHLRFWWRATAGARYSNAEELYKAETAIWGGATKDGEPVVGKVKISTTAPSVSKSDLKSYSVFTKEQPILSYVLFPFRSEAKCLSEIQFKVRLTFEERLEEEILVALKAWVTLGGVGSRTRRGCGSLQVLSAFLYSGAGRMEIQPHFFPNIPYDKQATADAPAKMLLTCLQGAEYIIGSPEDDAIEAWRKAVEAYAHFRQREDYARCQGWDPVRNRPQPGRSKWPEPDTIRRLAGKHFSKHRPQYPVDGFPRANLGLPIVFHFKDYHPKRKDSDPCNATLQRNENRRTRFASPVITKAVVTDDGKYAPLVLVLNSPNVWQGFSANAQSTREVLTLVFDSGMKKGVPRRQVELSDSDRYTVPPLNGLDARKALLEFVEKVMWQQSCRRGKL